MVPYPVTRISFKKFKKNTLNLGKMFRFFYIQNKNLLSTANINHLEELSASYFIVFDYILLFHLRKVFCENDINSKNTYSFINAYISKTHQNILKIQDFDPIHIKSPTKTLKLIWILFVNKGEKLSIVNFLESQRLRLKEVQSHFKKLKNLTKPELDKEFKVIAGILNNNLIVLGDLVFTRYCFASLFYQKRSYSPASRFYILYSLFLFDQTLLNYLFDILRVINTYQIANKDLLVQK